GIAAQCNAAGTTIQLRGCRGDGGAVVEPDAAAAGGRNQRAASADAASRGDRAGAAQAERDVLRGGQRAGDGEIPIDGLGQAEIVAPPGDGKPGNGVDRVAVGQADRGGHTAGALQRAGDDQRGAGLGDANARGAQIDQGAGLTQHGVVVQLDAARLAVEDQGRTGQYRPGVQGDAASPGGRRQRPPGVDAAGGGEGAGATQGQGDVLRS